MFGLDNAFLIDIRFRGNARIVDESRIEHFGTHKKVSAKMFNGQVLR